MSTIDSDFMNLETPRVRFKAFAAILSSVAIATLGTIWASVRADGEVSTAALAHPGVNSAATEDLQNVPASTHRQKRESDVGPRMMRLWLFGICALAVIGGAFLVGSRGSADMGNGSAPANGVAAAVVSAVTQVSMRNFQFHPVTIEVKIDDVVEWKNDDLVPHTATSASFNSGTVVSGQSWRHTFTDAGKFPYVCTFHPQMKGVVIVK